MSSGDWYGHLDLELDVAVTFGHGVVVATKTGTQILGRDDAYMDGCVCELYGGRVIIGGMARGGSSDVGHCRHT